MRPKIPSRPEEEVISTYRKGSPDGFAGKTRRALTQSDKRWPQSHIKLSNTYNYVDKNHV